MSLSELEEQNKFMKSLSEYWATKGITQNKIPQIGGQELSLYKLYNSVCRKGGGQAVSHNKMWKEIVDEFGLPSTCTSASFTLKNHYQKYLLGYEQRFLFGRDENAQLPQLVAGRSRRPLREGEVIGDRMIGRYLNEPYQSNLNVELPKAYEKADPSQVITYIKRSKMYPTMPQVKRLMLGFQSLQSRKAIYSINMLMLYSGNSETPFLFSQFPYVLDSIYVYLKRVYPAKNILDLQCIRNVTAALRNLCLSSKNLQPIIDSQLTDMLLLIFEEKKDAETTRNVIDIFSSLTKAGWDCRELFTVLDHYLEQESIEGLQTGIDLLRSLIELKEDECEKFITDRLDFFCRLLLHSNPQIRESILEIFAFLCQKSHSICLACGQDCKFINCVLALMAFGQGLCHRQAQLASYVLNDVSTLPANWGIFRRYQSRLCLIAASEQPQAKTAANILFRLSHGQPTGPQQEKPQQRRHFVARPSEHSSEESGGQEDEDEDGQDEEDDEAEMYRQGDNMEQEYEEEESQSQSQSNPKWDN